VSSCSKNAMFTFTVMHSKWQSSARKVLQHRTLGTASLMAGPSLTKSCVYINIGNLDAAWEVREPTMKLLNTRTHRMTVQCLRISHIMQSSTTTVIHSYFETSVYFVLQQMFCLSSFPPPPSSYALNFISESDYSSEVPKF
jgi:hypothetical protein